MRTIVHLSDLHFGRVDQALVGPLIASVNELRPDLVAVSGDLTQRALRQQFREARAFLDALPSPQIVVPGNHDVPLYNIFARFMRPLDNFREHITDDLAPFYADDEIAVLGINTARSLTIKDGRVNEKQIARIREMLCPLGDHVTKVIVTHHPFDLPAGHKKEADLVGRAELAMIALATCGADLLLAGHLHISHTGHTGERYRIAGHKALVISAGTATSTRGRGESNSFNVIRTQHPHIKVERYSWQPERQSFLLAAGEAFAHTPDGWQRLPEEVTAGLTFAEGSDGLQPTIPDTKQ